MKKMIYLVLVALTSLSACRKVSSEDLKEEVPYYQRYNVTYDKSLGTTEAYCYFRIRDMNGVRIELTGKDTVTANNTKPKTYLPDKTSYQWSFTGNPEVNFVLNKNTTATLRNSVSPADISNIAFAGSIPASVSKAAGFSFTWAGDALAPGETLDIRLLTFDSSGLAVKLVKSDNMQYTITFSAQDMQQLSAGDGRLEMIRRKTIPLDNEDQKAGGGIDMQLRIHKDLKVTN